MLPLYIFLSGEMDLVIKLAHEAKWKNASGSDDLSYDVSENGQNKYLILLILLPLFSVLSLLHMCVHAAAGDVTHNLYAWNCQTMELPTSSVHR